MNHRPVLIRCNRGCREYCPWRGLRALGARILPSKRLLNALDLSRRTFVLRVMGTPSAKGILQERRKRHWCPGVYR